MDFKNVDWKEGTAPLLTYLNTISEPTYRDFLKKITPGEFTILGVRIPILRNIAKTIYAGNYKNFLATDDEDIYELKLLKGLVIGKIKDLEEYKSYFNEFIPKIDNWAICDTFLSSSKIITEDRPYFFDLSRKLLQPRDEYKNRIAFVILLDYFVDREYLNKIFDLIKDYRSEHYYSNMALAWLLSVMYAKFPQETKEYLLKNMFDIEVSKYMIRKIKDSYRVSKEDKAWLDVNYTV